MSEIIAQKYVKAIINDKEIDTIQKELNTICQAYSSQKFLRVLSSNVKQTSKTDLMLSFINKPNQKTINLVKLLGLNSRLGLIPAISKELQSKIDENNLLYTGSIYSNDKLAQKDITDIEKTLAKKFDIKLKLNQTKSEFDGLKVTIDAMNIEIGLSKQLLKNRLKTYVLQAI
jgi:F-type H+-transporting ATPase subunit delta